MRWFLFSVYLNKGFDSYLALDIARIRSGEVWRLVTYIFVPQMAHPLWVAVALWFLWFIGDGLERAWGPFVSLSISGGDDRNHGRRRSLRQSVFQRDAFHDTLLRLCPLLTGGGHLHFFYPAAQGQMDRMGLCWLPLAQLRHGVQLLPDGFRRGAGQLSSFSLGLEYSATLRQRKEVAVRRQRFEIQSRSDEEPLHRCATCGATELTDPSFGIPGGPGRRGILPGASAAARERSRLIR